MNRLENKQNIRKKAAKQCNLVMQKKESIKKNFLTEETLESVSELGRVFQDIHKRIINDGFTIKDGKITKT